ncbi:MAG: GtrA family protein [Alphaproteobacteria bacterium]
MIRSLARTWREVVPPQTRATLVMLVRFGVSGVTAALTLFGTLFALTEYAGLWYVHSVLIASVVSFFVSFGLQKLWTFRAQSTGATGPQLLAFVALFLANSAINAGLLYAMVEFLHAPYLAAEVLIAILISIWNFIIMRYVIFRPVRETPNPGVG